MRFNPNLENMSEYLQTHRQLRDAGVTIEDIIKKALQQMRFNPNLENTSEYLQTHRQLRDAGVTTEKDYIYNILLSLAPEYDMDPTAIETVPANDVNAPFKGIGCWKRSQKD
jgi:uncharacterized protein YjiS (DUF1127 family)